MTTRKKGGRQTRQSYPDEFKAQAVKLADRVGTTAAARELGLQTSQIYNWRTKIRHAESTSEAENRLLTENARLKRELAEQRDELALLKRRRHTSRGTRSEVCLHRAERVRGLRGSPVRLAGRVQ